MKIRLTPEVGAAEWETLLDACPESTCFHSRSWTEALTHVYPSFTPLLFLAMDDAGRLLGALPTIRSVRWGLTQLLSLPYGTYGSPLVSRGIDAGHRTVYGALLERWRLEASRPGVVRAHLVQSPHDGPQSAEFSPVGRRSREVTHIVPLESGFESLWSSRFTGDKRTGCRRAVNLGVTVDRPRPSEGATILDALYRSSCRAWPDHTPYRRGLFETLMELSGDAARIWVARRDGRPVLASLILERGRRAFSWVTAGAPAARALRAANLLHVEILRDAADRGLSSLNLGASHGSSGLDAFKTALGGVETPYDSYLHEAGWFRPFHRAGDRASTATRIRTLLPISESPLE